MAQQLEDKDKRLKHFLYCLPHLSISDVGIKNICSRFGITELELVRKIQEFKRERGARFHGQNPQH